MSFRTNNLGDYSTHVESFDNTIITSLSRIAHSTIYHQFINLLRQDKRVNHQFQYESHV